MLFTTSWVSPRDELLAHDQNSAMQLAALTPSIFRGCIDEDQDRGYGLLVIRGASTSQDFFFKWRENRKCGGDGPQARS